MRLLADFRRCAESQRGSALIIVLLMVLILTVLGLSMLGLASSNMQMGDVDRDYQSVFYIAESGRDYEVEGLNDVVAQKCADVEDSDGFFTAMNTYFSDKNNYPKEIEIFDDQFGETVKATVRVEGMDKWTSGTTKHTYTLVSEGNIGGVKRQVASEIELTYTEGQKEGGIESDVGVFSLTTIYIASGLKVDGPVGTNTTQSNGIYFDWGATVGIY